MAKSQVASAHFYAHNIVCATGRVCLLLIVATS